MYIKAVHDLRSGRRATVEGARLDDVTLSPPND
jgi:hypothetical protein